ncbi:hypothetical protein BVX99_01400, partial [bacterium F16]
MVDWLTLPIFPQGALRESVVTTVWVGIFVFSLFNLRFGWTFSGLVVPGYLLPLIMLKPLTACVITGEAIISYYLVVLIAILPERLGIWCRFFGRDRFFAILLSSVVVRLVCDGWLLPEFGAYLQANWLPGFNYRADFFSFGTVVVALMANAFWKPGAAKGLMTLSIVTGVSFLLVRFILIPFTNFNITGLEFMYEDFATSFLASPKVYIVLLTVAFLASYLNRRYGWEYNGIIIPALFGLIWHQPLKVVFSFVEAVMVVIIALGVIRLPVIKDMTIEGARKLLLFFNISFLLKLILGHALIRYAPYTQITDYYGFGYLLPTLIAVKVFDKGTPLRLGVVTVQVAFVGSIIACIIGYSMTLLPRSQYDTPRTATNAPSVSVDTITLVDHLNNCKQFMYKGLHPGSFTVPIDREMRQFEEALTILKGVTDNRDGRRLQLARDLLGELQFDTVLIEDRYLSINESTNYRGWGTYVIDLKSPEGCIVEVPASLDEWSTFETGLALLRVFNARALAVAGSKLATNPDQSSNVLMRPRTPFHVFHKVMNEGNVIQVRGYSQKNNRRLFRNISGGKNIVGTPPSHSSLWVKNRMPIGVVLETLEQVDISLDIHWVPASLPNIQQDTSAFGFAELWLTRSDRRHLMSTTLYDNKLIQPDNAVKRIDGFLLDNILKSKTAIARAGTNHYSPPSLSEALYFDQEILAPIFDLSAQAYTNGGFTAGSQEYLGIISNLCKQIGYETIWYRHKATQQDYFILKEADTVAKRRHWGTFVIRLGEADPYLVQIPRPLYDQNSFEFGVRLFERLKARALVISGAHRHANRDGSADILNPDLKVNMVNLFSQVYLRSQGDRSAMVIQCRALSNSFPERDTVDGLIALADGTRTTEELSPLCSKFYAHLKENNLNIKLVDGSYNTAGVGINRAVGSGDLRQGGGGGGMEGGGGVRGEMLRKHDSTVNTEFMNEQTVC